MDSKELRSCRSRLEAYLAELLEPVGRLERRRWGNAYVRGLLLDGERKSIEPMAARLPDGNVQAMQQFIGQSLGPPFYQTEAGREDGRGDGPCGCLDCR